MIKFDKSDLQRFVVSGIGALALSATCVIAAVGPAKAADPAPMSVAAWQGKVQQRIENAPEPLTVYQSQRLAISQVAVRFTAEGDFAGAVLAKSSGDNLIDNRALKLARTVRYPAMPQGFRGMPTQVSMTLYFGPDAEAAAIRDHKKLSRNIQIAAM